MIKVLNVISDTNIGGAGRVILNYLRYADRKRFEIWIALPGGSLLKAPLEDAGGKIWEVDGIADRSYCREDVKVLQTLMGELRPDIVHTHGCLSGRIAAKRCRIPAVHRGDPSHDRRAQARWSAPAGCDLHRGYRSSLPCRW